MDPKTQCGCVVATSVDPADRLTGRNERDARQGLAPGVHPKCATLGIEASPMNIDPRQIEPLISDLKAIRESAFWLEKEYATDLGAVAPHHRESARNLLHYLALRRRDLRRLQDDLATLGLSSLGRAEAHVLATLDAVLVVLHRLAGSPPPSHNGAIGFTEGRARLGTNTEALFGPRKECREQSIRVMVTMPSTAAEDYEVVRNLVANGMTCMRINCAHETPEAWAAMIEHLRRACEETSQSARVFMDIAGPKIRTGPIEPGPSVIRWDPKRDARGATIAPAAIWLTPADAPEPPTVAGTTTIPVDRHVLSRFRPGTKLSFKDLRARGRTIELGTRFGSSWLGESFQTTYLGAETSISIRTRGKERDPQDTFTADAIPPHEQAILLTAGDTILLTAAQEIGAPVARDRNGQLLETPRIACTLPEVLSRVRVGERVLFDDGKIGGTVIASKPESLRIRITHPFEGTKRLRAYKGINFPDSDLGLPAITRKDIEDLDFIAEHADMIGFSFVHRPSDIEQLQTELARRTSREVGIVLKIETQRAFQELPRLLLAALRSKLAGVMIARGDLAVECGYERLAEVQEEILWICEAAHVPTIWATQVLDRLSKKGVPTRAEVTDAAMSERAECVMLNKGPHIVESVKLLRDITGRMEGHIDKKTPRLRALGVSIGRDEALPPRGR